MPDPQLVLKVSMTFSFDLHVHWNIIELSTTVNVHLHRSTGAVGRTACWPCICQRLLTAAWILSTHMSLRNYDEVTTGTRDYWIHCTQYLVARGWSEIELWGPVCACPGHLPANFFYLFGLGMRQPIDRMQRKAVFLIDLRGCRIMCKGYPS
jgi:hypothetical protein